MADKMGRNYILQVQLPRDSVGPVEPLLAIPTTTTAANNAPFMTFTLPLTIDFEITRKTFSSVNHAVIRMYNLSLDHRNNIRYNFTNNGEYRGIILRAGYGNNLPLVFKGNITQAYSYREGTTFITQIEAFDAGFAFSQGHTERSFPSQTELSAMLKAVLSDFPTLRVGAIGSSLYTDQATGNPIQIGRGQALSGPSYSIIQELTGGSGTSAFFVDNEVAHLLSTNEFIASNTVVQINSASGLLNTPMLETTIVHLEMLFEPALQVGYAAQLTSITDDHYNGLRKIVAVSHRGMISDAVCGECVTTGVFFYPDTLSQSALTGVPLS